MNWRNAKKCALPAKLAICNAATAREPITLLHLTCKVKPRESGGEYCGPYRCRVYRHIADRTGGNDAERSFEHVRRHAERDGGRHGHQPDRWQHCDGHVVHGPLNVKGAACGQYTNTSGSVAATNGGTGNTASANLTVAAPPTIAKVFGAATVALNGSTSLTFTITNPNLTQGLTGVAFTDNFPAGLTVASSNNLLSTCNGTATASPNSSSAILAAGTIAANSSCSVSLNVTGTTTRREEQHRASDLY